MRFNFFVITTIFIISDKCQASALYTFDYDMKDKSAANTMATFQNVYRTIHGTAHFTGRNSMMYMNRFAGTDLGDKLVVQLKFKFDRWGDDFDYGGTKYIIKL